MNEVPRLPRTEDRAITAAIDWLKVAVERFPEEITVVVCASKEEAREVHRLLRPTFGAATRLGSDESFSFDQGILVTDVRSVKGLEFMNVLLWNPSRKIYPGSDEDRNALYVAITRAEENLCIVSWDRPSPLLPDIFSTLVRGYDLEPADEQDGETQEPEGDEVANG